MNDHDLIEMEDDLTDESLDSAGEGKACLFCCSRGPRICVYSRN